MRKLNSQLIYVVAQGSDCDGCNSGSVEVYGSERIASYYAKKHNQWSDGIVYTAVNELEAIKYCLRYGKNPQQTIDSPYRSDYKLLVMDRT